MIKYTQNKTTYRYHIVSPDGDKTMCGDYLSNYTAVEHPAGITRSITCGNCSEKAAANKRARLVLGGER